MAVMLLASFVITAVVTPLAGWLARRLRIVDHPGPLKVQSEAVPYLGGLAVFCGLLVAPAVHRPILLLPLAAALGLGLADDVSDLPPKLRLACQVGIGAAVANLVRTDLPVPLGYIAVAITTVLLINAINLIDGLDALAGSVSLASAMGFVFILGDGSAAHALALTGALIGFLLYNRPPARIYLGDAGSYLIGTSLAILVAASWRQGQPIPTALAALPMVAYPVAEVTAAVIRRLRARVPMFQGDRGHVYDQLVARGWPVPRTSAACCVVQALLSGIGMFVSGLSPTGATVVVGAVVSVVFAGLAAAGFLSPAYAATDGVP